jgi:hypothetical protein
MGPNLEFDATPGEVNIRVMTLFLCDLPDAIGEGESLTEIFKKEFLFEAVILDAGPSMAQSDEKVGNRRGIKGGNPAVTGDTGFCGQITGRHTHLVFRTG